MQGWEGHFEYGVAFSPSGSLLAISGTRGQVGPHRHVWDLFIVLEVETCKVKFELLLNYSRYNPRWRSLGQKVANHPLLDPLEHQPHTPPPSEIKWASNGSNVAWSDQLICLRTGKHHQIAGGRQIRVAQQPFDRTGSLFAFSFDAGVLEHSLHTGFIALASGDELYAVRGCSFLSFCTSSKCALLRKERSQKAILWDLVLSRPSQTLAMNVAHPELVLDDCFAFGRPVYQIYSQAYAELHFEGVNTALRKPLLLPPLQLQEYRSWQFSPDGCTLAVLEQAHDCRIRLFDLCKKIGLGQQMIDAGRELSSLWAIWTL